MHKQIKFSSYLISIVCIEVGHNVAWIHSVYVQIVVVVVVVVDVIVHIDDQSHDASCECSKVEGYNCTKNF